MVEFFLFATPTITALITILHGITDPRTNFTCWRNSVITAQKLEKQLARLSVPRTEERDFEKELEYLNELVMEETEESFKVGDKVILKSKK